METNISTMILPPTNSSFAMNSLVDFHLKHNPYHPWAVLAATENQTEITITYQRLAHAVHRAAHLINPKAQIPEGEKVGLLATTNTILYITLILGIIRAGLVPFPISPRTQVAGVTKLLTASNTAYIIIGGNLSVTELGDHVIASHRGSLNVLRLPTAEELYPELINSSTIQEFQPFTDITPTRDNSLVIILHSSGSTGLPRPIEYHQRGISCNIVNSHLGYPGERVGAMAAPPFHLLGFLLQVLGPLTTGFTAVLFAPSSPPVVPTAELSIKTMVRSRCTSTFVVPTFIEAWAKDEIYVDELKKFRLIFYGGGPLTGWAGHTVANQGVRICPVYGSTETGCVTCHDHCKRSPADWAYVEFGSHVDVCLVDQHDADKTYEVVHLETENHKPFMYNYEINGRRAYRTKDLVTCHATKPGLWRFVGRVDDQIILLNGEKTNPGSMEDEIQKCPVVQFAVMFGRERNQTGVLIELVPACQPRILDSSSRAELLDEIWPFIEKANATSSTHSRLDKSTIIFTRPDRPLPRTSAKVGFANKAVRSDLN